MWSEYDASKNYGYIRLQLEFIYFICRFGNEKKCEEKNRFNCVDWNAVGRRENVKCATISKRIVPVYVGIGIDWGMIASEMNDFMFHHLWEAHV